MATSNLCSSVLLVLISFFSTFSLSAQQLKSGPMQGHTTDTEMKVWIMVHKPGRVELTLSSPADPNKHSLEMYTPPAEFGQWYPVTFYFKDLKPNTTYTWEYSNDDVTLKGNSTLHTYPSQITGDFSFLIGSCAVRLPKAFNFAHPGVEERIYEPMMRTEGDFMVWLGDNLYLKSKQMMNSLESIDGQYVKQRLIPSLQAFLKSRPQYAIWDDHDYGPNDGDATFEYKEQSLEGFSRYWPNASFGLPGVPGVFFTFNYGDAQFFMTDDRYHRTQPEDEQAFYLGPDQMKWLQNELLNSNATFKFIATGNQALSPVNPGESYIEYEREQRELFQFIEENKISGVIFLTGDRHHTELLKVTDRVSYPIYEFTSSALTSIGIRPKNSKELVNPVRVPNTLVFDNNYGRISIKGPADNRLCIMETYSNNGELIWSETINANELQIK